ncbi:MAG: hypothetical protein IPK73_27420 [Candidatus Obscuribacter sp.]|nr:hypothetical protein [Candidatus Obscuribacter sp.]MBK9277856.1 hypothetical protein [Candidatus Obscuribacter sp.]MBL8086011.1 hypothetical protein [Candidatus Obscuribacter sp.]
MTAPPPSPLPKLRLARIAAIALSLLGATVLAECQAAPSSPAQKAAPTAGAAPSGTTSQSNNQNTSQTTAKATTQSTKAKGTATGAKSQGLLTAAQAKKLVEERPEVKEWLALFKKPSAKAHPDSKPVIEVEKDGKNWNVHVFEALPDHTATFNWYSVDPATKKISPMF